MIILSIYDTHIEYTKGLILSIVILTLDKNDKISYIL